ncbi:MAG: NnrU family protein, partial [Pseudomonadota bacterium]
MLLLILGLALWWAAHLFKAFAPARRAELEERLGLGPTRLLMTGLLVLSVLLMTIGYQQADYIELWYAPWAVHLNNLLMVVAVVLFFAGGFAGHMRHWVRHPQLSGFKAWAVGHLLVNGHVAGIVLFGGLLAWAVLAMILINKRDGKGPKPEPTGMKANLMHAGVSVVAFVVLIGAHTWLGVSPFR